MSPSQVLPRRPRVVAMGSTEYRIDDYVAEYERTLTLRYAPPCTPLRMQSRADADGVLDAENRDEALQKLPAMVQQHGPIDALVVGVGTAEFEPFDEALLRPLLPGCRIIASASAGYDEFDVAWMTRAGIWFCNTRDAVAEATADMAMFLTLAVVRDAYRAERGARSGTWRDGIVPARDPSGMTMGIVGMGAVGRHLARKAAAFSMRVRYYNRRRLSIDDEAACNAKYTPSLHELLASADVVSINCPLTEETANLISDAEFAAMKPGAFFVNTARGAIVDEAALIDALESGRVARAGLDVFCNEPHINGYFRTSDLVVCTPHVGAVTDEAFRRGERECLENVRACLRTGRPVAPVNEVRADVNGVAGSEG
ncbi:Putative 2-hydroxyacid dehydrogenase [Tolypocladium paradoxum]|uniref:2-hydroxyacid dehydrogenase n=1 Tax=Tolypocladium paradoxum TaxID=94208 RepID=A0A2S4KWE5_9HYPO|nr:Putative 2-hydroxyacid dehydrogenase [Tolypocladium paradoxum]